MSDDIITPSGMGGSKETKSVLNGWRAMQESKKTGKPVAKKPITEQVEQTEEQSNPYYKGNKSSRAGADEGISAEDLTRHLKRQSNKMLTESVVSKKMFKGSSDLCMTKLAMLFNGPERNAANENAQFTPKILNIKESGYGNYTIYWTE